MAVPSVRDTDGVINATSAGNDPSGDPGVITFTGVESVTKLEIYGANDSGTTISVNGSVTSIGTVPAWYDATSLLVDGKFIALTLASTGAQGCRVDAIRVNDKLLISFSSIGKDSSGQGNNFQDENFAVGNTDEVWSKNSSGWQGSAALMFDGSLSTESYASSSSGATVSWDAITAQTSIEFYIKDQSADKGNLFASIDGCLLEIPGL